MEPKDWIAVAQVYATLAQGLKPVVGPEDSFTSATIYQSQMQAVYKYESMALTALRAAGVQG